MRFDFTTIMHREGEDALAVDRVGPDFMPHDPAYDFIPMWVADMNFPTAPSILEAVAARAAVPHFGYFEPRAAYYDSIIRWQETRSGVTGLQAKHIGYENGVLGGVVSALAAIAEPGDEVLLHSPTYIGFTHALEDNGYRIVHSPLKQDEDGVWRMDYADMEKTLTERGIHAAILCSPHNPCGRVWEREELEQALAVYEKCGVTVISDEIWSDILLDGHRHIPTQQVNAWARENVIAMYAPSKTFSLAGLIGSYHIVYNDALRRRMEAHGSRTHYNSMNVLSQHALIGAYSADGAAWADELCAVLSGNAAFAVDFIRTRMPGIRVSQPEGTYMLFIDCTEYCAAHGKTIGDVLKAGWQVGVGWQDGRPFHGPCYIRMNLALPLSRVQEAFARLEKALY